jgi:hypothetical protein
VMTHALSRRLGIMLLAQMSAWISGMACVSAMGVAQALVCLFVWTMVLDAAARGHMVPKMPFNYPDFVNCIYRRYPFGPKKLNLFDRRQVQ